MWKKWRINRNRLICSRMTGFTTIREQLFCLMSVKRPRQRLFLHWRKATSSLTAKKCCNFSSTSTEYLFQRACSKFCAAALKRCSKTSISTQIRILVWGPPLKVSCTYTSHTLPVCALWNSLFDIWWAKLRWESKTSWSILLEKSIPLLKD